MNIDMLHIELPKEDYTDILTVVKENEGINSLFCNYPEANLLLAIFKRAVEDLNDPNTEITLDAREWFLMELTENPTITSFQMVCLVFNLNIQQVLSKLKLII